ncbi:hypothetical protein [Nocardia farcinica]
MSTESEPQYTTTLLDQLGVGTDPILRRRAIAAWLAEHTPSAKLVRSLRRSGYGDLLPD